MSWDADGPSDWAVLEMFKRRRVPTGRERDSNFIRD